MGSIENQWVHTAAAALFSDEALIAVPLEIEAASVVGLLPSDGNGTRMFSSGVGSLTPALPWLVMLVAATKSVAPQ